MTGSNKIRFRFDWKLSLLVLVLLPLCMRLGFWQLAREQEKLQLQQAWMERQQELPVPLASLDTTADLQYTQVLAEGRYDNEHVFLLDNRTHEGRVGFEVVQPFLADGERIVLVNRGWIEQGSSRSDLPLPELLNGTVQLRATVYVPVGTQLVLGNIAPGAEWPKLVQTLDPGELSRLAGYAQGDHVFPYVLRLAEGSPGVLERNWSVISTSPEKHRGYAVQWFAMASALVLLFLYYSFRRRPSEENED